MHSLVWRASARDDLRSILTYIAARNPSAARRLRELVENAVLQLPSPPDLVREGRVPGTRERVVHPNSIVVDRVTAAAIEIVSVWHARLPYP